MKGYTMPDWLHNVTGWLTSYGVRHTRESRPPTLLERVSLRAAALLLSVTHQAGVWGRL